MATALQAVLAVFSGCATEEPRWKHASDVRSSEGSTALGAALDQRPTPVVRTEDGEAGSKSASPRDSSLTRVSDDPDSAKPGEAQGIRPADLRVTVPSPTVIPAPPDEYPIDLSTALRLASVENPTIAAARAAIIEALAVQTGARALLLPSLNAGTNYHNHTGNLQRSSGRILSLSEQSLYFGGGARTLAAESVGIPAVNLVGTLTEGWFEPLAARQRVISTSFTLQFTANEVLLDVAKLHLELLANQAILEAQRLTESQVYQVAIITNDYASTGQGRKADANRSQAEWKRHRVLVQKAEEAVAVAAARLSNRLNLDPSVRLIPMGGPLVPINLIALDTETRELIDYALRRRPDLTARTADVARAEVHYHEELARPWIPTVLVGFSGGVFGGGSNIVPPTLGHFGGRTDFDVRLFWTLMNLGAGNLSLQNRRFAEIGEAEGFRVATINRIREEVTSSRADALAGRSEIEIARSELSAAENSFHQDLDRTRQNLGRPIEVLNSLNLLGDARVNLLRAILHYDQAQFRLYVALGSPPPLLTTPSTERPPGLTTPIHTPIPAVHPIHTFHD